MACVGEGALDWLVEVVTGARMVGGCLTGKRRDPEGRFRRGTRPE
jgi:hypothetical protein